MQFSGNDEERKENRISGGNGEREPPVPIPNTEVKPLSAESTWLETARENRTLPDSKRLRRVISTQSFFLPQFLKDLDGVEEIKDIEKVMLENNALGSMMSGSGPTVFGLFDKEEDALSAKGELLKKYNQVYVVRSSEKGVEVNGEFN